MSYTSYASHGCVTQPVSVLRSAALSLVIISVLQIILWTVIPSAAFTSFPLDVVENIAWGEQWQLGYYKHPPLQAWLTGLAYQTTGAGWPIYLLSQLAVSACFLAIWMLGRGVVEARGRLLAVVFFSLLYYANIPTPEFNANVLQMPIWAFAPLLLWRALIAPRALGWWVALGVTLALAVYAKYSAVVLAAALVAAALATPQGRAALRMPGPYIAAAVTTVLILPQMAWLLEHDFLPFNWVGGRIEKLEGLAKLASTAKFLGAQFADHAGALALISAGCAGRIGWRSREGINCATTSELSDADRYILVTAFAPIAIVTMASVLFGMGLHDMWAAPMFTYTGLAVAIWLRRSYDCLRWRAMTTLWAVLFVAAPIGVGLTPVVGPLVGAKPMRVALEAKEFGRVAQAVWTAATGRQLMIVAGSTWEAGLVSTYATDRPALFVDGDFKKSPWITPAQLATEGALLVWQGRAGDPPPQSLAALGPLLRTGVFEVPYRYSHRKLSIAWAIVAPSRAIPTAAVR